MSIADKITSIETHLEADYEGLENIYGEITGINKNILNIRTILDNVYNDLPKVTGEGTEVTLTPTRKGRLALIPKGNSTQESTTGKNLFNLSDLSGECISDKTSTSFKFTRTGYARFSNTIQLPKTIPTGTTIHSSADITNSTFADNIQLQFGSDSSFSSQITSLFNANKTLNIDVNYVRIYVASSEAMNTSCTINNLQIEIGTAKTDYEQYTSGIPAPNPSYPFPIKSVTGNNNVVVKAKNMAHITGVPSSAPYISYSNDKVTLYTGASGSNFILLDNSILFEAGQEYLLELFLPQTSTNSKTSNILLQKTGNVAFVDLGNYLIGSELYKSFSFTPNENLYMTRIQIYNSSSNVITADTTFQVQIRKAGTSTGYQEYITPVTKPLNLGTKKVMLDDTMQDDGIHHKRKQTILGNMNAQGIRTATIFGKSVKYATYSFSDMVNNSQYEYKFFCNKVSRANGAANLYSGYTAYGNLVVIVDDNDTVETANSKLSDAIFEYELATEETEAYTETQQAQYDDIQKMKSYEGTTIITSTFDENNSQMIISASGLKGEE